MSGQETVPVRTTKPRATIPPLRNLVYEQCGYIVPNSFAGDFVGLHRNDWARAERDWEDIVALVLDTDAVHPRATGGTAIKQAVEAAAAFLTDGELWPWCPRCRRTSGDLRKERADGR